MRMLLLAVLTVALAPAWGQKLDLRFDGLAAKAKETAEVDLDGPALTAALKSFAPKKVADAGAGLTGLFVRNYEFATAGAYAQSDLAALRKQVSAGSGWSRIINVKEQDETTEVYLYGASEKPSGLLIISAEAKELTVVNLLGSVQVAQLAQLQELVHASVQYDLRKGSRSVTR